MDSKYAKPLRILTPVFALTLLSTYVVYSQLTHARTVAPGSKSMIFSGQPARDATASATGTNADQIVRGTKSKAGFERSEAAETNFNETISVRQLDDLMVAASSKSGPVFDFRLAQPGNLIKARAPARRLATDTNTVTLLQY